MKSNGIVLREDFRRLVDEVSFWTESTTGVFLRKAMYFTVAAVTASAFLFPFYWLVRIALTWPAGIGDVSTISLLIEDPKLFNFVRIFYDIDFFHYLYNSIVITTLGVIGTVIINSLAGYGLRMDFHGKRLVLGFLVAALMVPTFVTVIPSYLISRQLGLLNTHLGVALPFMAGIVGTFLFKHSFESVPDSTIEAARMDGASELYILFGVLLPLSKAALATNVILTFTAAWNSYLWPLVIVTDRDMYPLPLAIANFTNQFRGEYALAYAFTILVLLPVAVVFLLLQRQFIESVVHSALKE